MYGLPTAFDASRFVRLTLEQVSFTINTVHLSFSDDVSITLESSFEHLAKDGKPRRLAVPVTESQLMQLLGESVESAHASTDGTLSLRFGDGQALTCYDDAPMYEAYRLRFGDEEIVV